LTEWRRLAPPPVNVGAAASRIFDGAPTQAGSPAEFYCSRPAEGSTINRTFDSAAPPRTALITER